MDWLAAQLIFAASGSPWQQVALLDNAARLGALCRVEAMAPQTVSEVLAVNVVAPIFLMGFMARTVAVTTPLQVVNISSGAAQMGIPGLADYCASKAALRLAGMSLAAEFDQQNRNATVFSYEPGVVETDMQVAAQATDPADFPSHQVFQDFVGQGVLAQPEAVVGEILAFLNSAIEENSSNKTFTERRLGAT